jgi:hypothetical protein
MECPFALIAHARLRSCRFPLGSADFDRSAIESEAGDVD